MATGNIYKVRYHAEETVTSGGAHVQNNFADSQVLVAGTTLAAALALVPAPPSPAVGAHSNTNIIDSIAIVEQGVILS